MNERDFENIISQDLEVLSADELLAMSESLSCDGCPEPTQALEDFKRDYLPEASEVSLYDDEPKRRQARRINLKHLVTVAAVVALMAACSIVSYAAGAASGGKETDKSVSEASDTEEEPLKTGVEINGSYRELYVIKPIDENADDYSYSPNKLGNKDFLTSTYRAYNAYCHYADLDGNVLEFEKITYSDEEYNELRERLKQKAREQYDAKFVEDLEGFVAGIELCELSDFDCMRCEADDYYMEYIIVANYEIVSRDPFTQIYDKIYVNYDANFQMETQVIIYAECYNPEKGVYQEFLSSKTAVGPFEVAFEIPQGWMLVDGEIILQNQLIGRHRQNLTAYASDTAQSAAELAAFREKLNAALEKYYQQKVERNDVIDKIEEKQNS